MDIFLIRKYKYHVNDSVENIRASLLEITNRKWHDFSNNISGFLRDDNTFKFTHKWEIGFSGGSGSTVYLNGKIREENENVFIDITIRPNIGLLFFIYL